MSSPPLPALPLPLPPLPRLELPSSPPTPTVRGIMAGDEADVDAEAAFALLLLAEPPGEDGERMLAR